MITGWVQANCQDCGWWLYGESRFVEREWLKHPCFLEVSDGNVSR